MARTEQNYSRKRRGTTTGTHPRLPTASMSHSRALPRRSHGVHGGRAESVSVPFLLGAAVLGPQDVIHPLGIVDTMVGVGAEEVALPLDEGGRQPRRAELIDVRQ